MQILPLIKRFFAYLGSIFLNGLFTLLPLALTVALFVFSFKLISGWIHPLQKLVPLSFRAYPHSEFILVLLFIFCVGAVLKYLLLHPLIHFFESILSKIPLVKTIYFGLKQLIHAFSAQDETTFKQVVLVEYPRAGVYSIGFITNEHLFASDLRKEVRYVHLYVPTVPNPATGHLLIVPENEVIRTNISRQDALTLIISGGIIQPGSQLQPGKDIQSEPVKS